MNDAKGRDPAVALEKGGKEASLGGGGMCPELMNILIVVCLGIRNLKV